MDATIAAACISGVVGALGIAGTVVTSVVGSRNTRRATERTVEAGATNTRATLSAAREDRLWERCCAVYEETLSAMAYRQFKLNGLLAGGGLKDAPEEEMENVSHSYGSPEWAATQGRLTAYASDAAWEAARAATVVGGGVRESFRSVRKALDEANEANRSGKVSDDSSLKEAIRVLNDAFRTARDADKALIDIIRDELRSRPEAATPPPALPAVRRRSLLRRRALYR